MSLKLLDVVILLISYKYRYRHNKTHFSLKFYEVKLLIWSFLTTYLRHISVNVISLHQKKPLDSLIWCGLGFGLFQRWGRSHPIKAFQEFFPDFKMAWKPFGFWIEQFFSESRSKCTAKASEEFSPINFKYCFPVAKETMVLQLFTLCFQGIESLQWKQR